jgi:hypothetical protein
MVADNLWIRYLNGTWGWAAGTSAAAPLWAGFSALVNQQAANFGRSRVGFMNPALYAIGKGSSYSSCFHDITTGNNFNSINPNKYSATNGYDLCTGWGTPNGLNLINALALGTQSLNAKLHYVGSGRCDPGPVAGGTATFEIEVVAGMAPYTFQWSQSNTPITAGGGTTSSKVSVTVPPLGVSGTLSVTVTDVTGNQVTVSVTVTGLDPKFAGPQERLCEILSQMDRFKRPLYINPGDPGPIEFWFNPYSESDLKTMQKTIQELDAIIAALRQRGANSPR